MNSGRRLLVAAGFVALSAAVSLLAAPDLPEQVVSHWNAAGQPDGTLAKPVALALIPALTAVLVGLLAVVPRIDPLGENIASFRRFYDWFIVLFAGYMFVVHAGIVAYNLGHEFDFVALVLGGVAVLFLYLGVLLPRAERNWFVGIRTPWTLSSDVVWERTHDLGGRLFLASGVLSLVGLAFGEYAIYFVVGPALVTALVTVVYSYVVYERLDDGAATGVGL